MIEELEKLAGFRAEVRAWLAANLPRDWRTRMRGASDADHIAFQKFWFGKLHAGGYSAPHLPKRWGGSEFSFAQQIVLYEEIARAGAPRLVLYFISLYHAPSTLLEFGSAEQQARYMPPIVRGEEIWCQGFSEPNAGSDLASLSTRAVREGDHYVVNGQKIWSSSAQYARFCLLLARTDPGVPKHEGISYFILDLTSPGVSLRPIRMLTGESHFCEIFLDSVRIPAVNLIGAENKGWFAAQATLASERGLTILELTERMRIAFRLLLEDAAAAVPHGPRALDDDEVRRRLVDIHTRLEALRLLVNEMLSRVLRRGERGVEPSMIKVYYSELLKDFTELGVQIGGMDAQYLQPIVMGGGYETGYWMHDHLYSWSWTIAGGSNEVQRNIIAERGLGLPREPSLKHGSIR